MTTLQLIRPIQNSYALNLACSYTKNVILFMEFHSEFNEKSPSAWLKLPKAIQPFWFMVYAWIEKGV